MQIKRMFAGAKKNGALELLVYDVIGADWFGEGVTVAGVAAQIKAAGDFASITVRINSPGGDVFEGVSISNLLRAQGKPVNVIVDGVAASAASLIAMAGDTVAMGQGAMLMIHNAWTMARGQASDLRKSADVLDKISESMAESYATKTGKTVAEIQALMEAETWLSADESVTEGFATEVIKRAPEDRKAALALAAVFSAQFAKAPAFEVIPEPQAAPEPVDDWQGRLDVYQRHHALMASK